ncbi:MAG: diguanylate cyclase [Kofleriaceae bacterium]
MQAPRARVLIVEDEALIARHLRDIITADGYEVVGVASNATMAIESAQQSSPDLVLMDIRIKGDRDGIATAAAIREQRDIPVVFLTANADRATLDRALDTAPGGYLTKPFNEDSLRTTIAVALRSARHLAHLNHEKRALEQHRGQLQELAERFEKMSLVDALTGLGNRRSLDEAISAQLALARREQHHVGVIMVDLDHFKQVNDHYGHAAGDAVLRAVAQLLRFRLRAYDIVCRYGGEELAVIVPGANAENAVGIADKLRKAISELTVPEAPKEITASFGVAVFPYHEADELFLAADRALYRAKANGRNRVELAD